MWFKKKQTPIERKPELGFFGTDDMPIGKSGNSASRYAVEKLLARSFQKPIQFAFPVAPDGSMATMDSVCEVNETALTNGADFLPAGQLGWYASQGFIGYQMCAMIAQNWLVDKACSMPAKDAMRNGYEITVNDGTKIAPEIIEEIKKADKRYNVRKHGVEFVRNGRIFGIRIAMFNIESSDPMFYENPFNIDGVTEGSYKGITQIDPYWITPELNAEAASNPMSPHFYEPTFWRVNGKRIHRSHLIVMKNGEVPDILKPSYIYGGVSVPQKIAERIYAAERTANEAPLLAMTKRMTVLNTDVEKAMANFGTFSSKMNLWTQLMNNFGIKIIGGKETIQQFDTSLADLDAVIMTQYQIVAAAAGVPATKLLGTTPKGFNSTGEYEEASYHEELESIQEHDLSPLIERHHMLIIHSEIAPKFKIAPFSTDLNWLPIDSPTSTEVADVNLKNAQTDQALVNIGAIDGVDVRNRLIADRASGYNGMEAIVEGLNDEEDEETLDNIEGESLSTKSTSTKVLPSKVSPQSTN